VRTNYRVHRGSESTTRGSPTKGRPTPRCGSPVLGDGVELFRSSQLTRHSDPVQIDVDVRDVHYLDLVVDRAGDGIFGDHADWASAQLAC